jgi:hypothetical protein
MVQVGGAALNQLENMTARRAALLAKIDDAFDLGQRQTDGLGRSDEPQPVQHRLGAPTILVNGHDPFADPADPVGLSCRIYRNPAGVEHAPTIDQLRAVLADPR